MTTLAEVAVRFKGDVAALVKDATAAGQKSGEEAGKAFGVGFGRLGAAAISGLLAGTAANLVVLDTAARKYAASVGADAAEMEKAKVVANEFFKTNTQGYDEILGSLAKLRTDQGLTLEQAQAVEQAYLRFSKVAGTDAATAVKQFDDVQDAWNLTAADGVRIMDQLVASNQKYGGSLQQRVLDLHSLAPALQALNLTVDDAIGLENVFAAAGIDASDVLRGLNTAVKNLKPGETLQGLIDQIASIESPTARAQKAMELFGPRVGAAIAQAFGPDKAKSIDDYKVSVGDAGDATKRAADVMDGSIPKQFELFLHNLQGTLAGLGDKAGPIFLMVAAVGSLGQAFDLMKVKAILAWAASAGPGALVAGAALVAALALIEAQLNGTATANNSAAVAAFDYTGKLRALDTAVADGTMTQQEADAQTAALTDQYRNLITAAGNASGALITNADAADRNAAATGAAGDASGTAATSIGTIDPAAQAAAGALAGMGGAADGTIDPVTNAGNAAMTAAGKFLTLAAAEATWRRARGISATQRDTGTEPGAGNPAGGMSAAEYYLFELDQLNKNLPPKITTTKTGLSDVARVAGVEMTNAFRIAKGASDALMDSIHQKALADIEVQRRQAYATAERTAAEQRYNLEKSKQALFAPVDAEQSALDARRTAEQRSSLAQGVADAARAIQTNTDPTRMQDLRRALIAATQALRDFDEQAKVNADRAAAQAAATALDQGNIVDPVTGKTKIDQDLENAKHAADVQAQVDKDKEDKAYTVRKKAFDDRFDLLEKELQATKSTAKREAILKEIQGLYDKYGLDAKDRAKESGRLIALALADGLKQEVKAVEAGAEALVTAINKYIRTHSPAQAGPWHDDPPVEMGRRFARQLTGGIDDHMTGYEPHIFDMASPASAAAAGSSAAAVAASAHFTFDMGEWVERMLGAPRFLEFVETGLVRKSRS